MYCMLTLLGAMSQRREVLTPWSLTPRTTKSIISHCNREPQNFGAETLEQAGKSTWHRVALYRFKNSGSQQETGVILCCLPANRCFSPQNQSISLHTANIPVTLNFRINMNELQISLCCFVATSMFCVSSVL